MDERVGGASLTIVLDADPAEGRCLARRVAQSEIEPVGARRPLRRGGIAPDCQSGSEGYPGIDVVRVHGRRAPELARRLGVLTAFVAEEPPAVGLLGLERPGRRSRESRPLFGCRLDTPVLRHEDQLRLSLNDLDRRVQGVDRGLGDLIERRPKAARILGVVRPMDLARRDNVRTIILGPRRYERRNLTVTPFAYSH